MVVANVKFDKLDRSMRKFFRFYSSLMVAIMVFVLAKVYGIRFGKVFNNAKLDRVYRPILNL